MHESAIAQNLLGIISAQISEQKARPLTAKISCGILSAVNDELLISAFKVIAKDTLCESMTLKIEHKPLQGQCGKCRERFEIDISRPRCPKCNSEDFELLPDAPLILEEIDFETEKTNA